MAKQTQEQVKKSLGEALGTDENQTQQLLFAGVTQDELDAWKAKYGKVHIITVADEDGNKVTGYFKKPGRDIMANCVNLVHDKKTYEAREFLLINAFIGGDVAIKTNYDYMVSAQTKLWGEVNFLTAEALKY